MSDLTNGQYQQLIKSIGDCLASGQQSAMQQVNRALVETYWNIGRYIVEFEQQGQEKAEYGSRLLAQLSKDLKQLHGKGFSRRNLLDMRRLYLTSSIWQTVSAKLSWSHYTELLAISDELARSFYEQQCIHEPIGIVFKTDRASRIFLTAFEVFYRNRSLVRHIVQIGKKLQTHYITYDTASENGDC